MSGRRTQAREGRDEATSQVVQRRERLRGVLVVCLLLFPCTAFATTGEGQDPAVAAALESVLDGRYQAELPADVEDRPTQARGRTRPRTGRREALPDGTAAISGARALAMILIVVLLVGALAWAVGRSSGGAALPSDRAGAARPPPDAKKLLRPLTDARALAAEGRFGEAIHMLLLRALHELARHCSVDPALTSREILGRVPLPASAREALGAIATQVEWSHFGRREVGAAEFEACEQQYQAFVRHWAGGEEPA